MKLFGNISQREDMKIKKRKEVDMVNGPLLPKILSYSLIIMVTNLPSAIILHNPII